MNTEPTKNGQPGNHPSLRQAIRHLPSRLWGFMTHNWGWKLLSLLLAIGLWAGLITQDPTLTREHAFDDVTVTISGADILRRNGMVVLSGLDDESLSVRLRANVPQREYNTVSAANFNPRVDLSRITETGEQTLKVLTTPTTTFGNIKSISPDSINVVVDYYVANYRVPVSINPINEYPVGFYGSAPALSPSTVTVSGPQSIVDRVARIYVDFDLSRIPAQAGQLRYAMPMRFADADGNTIESDLLEISSAGVVLRSIIVEQQLYPTKTLSLSSLPLIIGQPAQGYALKNIIATPSTLLAAGDTEALAALDTLFPDTPIDLDHRSETFTVEIALRKPSDLAYLSAESVTFTVEIEPVTITHTYGGIKLSTRGLRDGLSVKLSQKLVNVSLTGPQALIADIKSPALHAYVDVSGLTAGEHELPVLLQVDDVDITSLSHTLSFGTVTAILTENGAS
ncbi:MAG: CdaR family protein [Clostridia bacterium]